MIVVAKTLWRLRCLIDAAPTAWRQDRIFRGAAIGSGVTALMLLVRLAGPAAPVSPAPGIPTVPPGVLTLPGPAGGLSPQAKAPPIAPGQLLDGVTIVPVPVPDPDRFGSFKPGARP